MKLCFLGTSHAVKFLSMAAQEKGFALTSVDQAQLIFVSEDTPTDETGKRDLDAIRSLIEVARKGTCPIILTSAVPPGFCRSLDMEIWHQAEILRIKDAQYRSRYPEMMIVGSKDESPLPMDYRRYLSVWNCPILTMTYEEAEFSKLAINIMLAAQVDTTNRLEKAAIKVGAKWEVVANALKHDSRIGKYAYLEPGRWQDSPHLLRDDLTLRDILR